MKKFYNSNTNNTNHISSFKIDFIKRVTDKHKIQKNVSTLSKQRKAFIKRIVINPNGSPLKNNNFSNQNPLNSNNI